MSNHYHQSNKATPIYRDRVEKVNVCIFIKFTCRSLEKLLLYNKTSFDRELMSPHKQSLLFYEIIKISEDDRIKDGFDNDQIFDTLNISKSRKLKDLF